MVAGHSLENSLHCCNGALSWKIEVILKELGNAKACEINLRLWLLF
jgi:hypothetical protein